MNRSVDQKKQFKRSVWDWAHKLEAPVTSVVVRPMKTKWASCSTTGRLTFDVFLVGVQHDVQDYVIVHELLHFRIPNHGKLWKSLMRAHLGDYEICDSKLKEFAKREL